VCRVFFRKGERASPAASGRLDQEALLACFYLGWLYQASFLQRGFDYQHLPSILLALVVVANWLPRREDLRMGRVCLVAFASLALLFHPLLRWERTTAWGRCISQPSSYDLWDRLALTEAVDWQDLARVAAYLRAQEVKDREVTCFSVFTTPLYIELDQRPSSRFIQVSSLITFFSSRQQEMVEALGRGPQRFLVSDVRDFWTSSLSAQQARAEQPHRALALPPDFPPDKAQEYPWTEPVVFRAGRYYVHRAKEEPGRRDEVAQRREPHSGIGGTLCGDTFSTCREYRHVENVPHNPGHSNPRNREARVWAGIR
jgi:hypothetical protein